MIVIDFLLYSFYRFCRAVRGQTPEILAETKVGGVLAIHLIYLGEIIAKYVFHSPLKDSINVPVGGVIIYMIIMILLSFWYGKHGYRVKKAENFFKTRSFHKTSFYVLVTLGIDIWTILLGIFLYTYVI